jgi:nucleotide-binding universal stress UspA family protein
MIQHILAAVDGSTHADKAVELAGDLAHQYGAKLTLIHVTPDYLWGTVPRDLQSYADAEHVGPGELMQSLATKLLDEAARRARDRGAERVESVSDVGDPASRIIAYARDHGCDLVVMGTRGLSDLQGLLLGSVAHKVSHLAPCTCITVR